MRLQLTEIEPGSTASQNAITLPMKGILIALLLRDIISEVS